MEKNFTGEVIVLLLPLSFSKSKFESEKCIFLSFNEIVKEDHSFSFSGHSLESLKEKNMISLFEEIDKHDFSDYLLEKLEKLLTESEKKIILVNFPNNIEQFNILSSKLARKKIIISKVVVANFETFENFERISSNTFTCPFCFDSFDKDSCLSEEKSLVCPFDGNATSLSFSQKFVKSFGEHYFKNNLDFAQSLSSVNDKELYQKPSTIPLIIPEVDQIEDFLIKKMSEIL